MQSHFLKFAARVATVVSAVRQSVLTNAVRSLARPASITTTDVLASVPAVRNIELAVFLSQACPVPQKSLVLPRRTDCVFDVVHWNSHVLTKGHAPDTHVEPHGKNLSGRSAHSRKLTVAARTVSCTFVGQLHLQERPCLFIAEVRVERKAGALNKLADSKGSHGLALFRVDMSSPESRPLQCPCFARGFQTERVL